jgi:anti-anti-sigma factor
MKITVTEHLSPTVTIFHLDGQMQLDNAIQLREQAQQAYDRGARNLILELSGLQAMTSERLRSINFINNLFLAETNASGNPCKPGRVKLAQPSSDVLRILRLTGFELFLEIFPTPQDALASF